MEPRDEDLRKAFGDVLAVGALVAAVVTANSVPALFANLASAGSRLGPEGALGIFSAYLATFPLTTAAAILFVFIFSGQTSGTHTGALAGVLLLVATLLGNYLGLGSAGFDPWPIMAAGGVMAFVPRVLLLYLVAYGFWSFVSSITIGLFATYAWAKLSPHLLR